MKKCSNENCYMAGELQSFENFSKNKTRKDGLQNTCKACAKIYRNSNTQDLSEYKKQWYLDHKEEILQDRKEYRLNNKDKISERNQKNKAKRAKYQKEYNTKYYKNNKDDIARRNQLPDIKSRRQVYDKSWRINNTEYCANKRKEFTIDNPTYHYEYSRMEQRKQIVSLQNKQRRTTDPAFKLISIRRGRRNKILKGLIKNSSKEDLGCTVQEWRDYLESKFQPGMSWTNHTHDGWHLDEIIPCSAWDMSDPDHQKACFHYFNSQPLWAKDNIRKGGSNRKDYTAEINQFLMVLRALGIL